MVEDETSLALRINKKYGFIRGCRWYKTLWCLTSYLLDKYTLSNVRITRYRGTKYDPNMKRWSRNQITTDENLTLICQEIRYRNTYLKHGRGIRTNHADTGTNMPY